MKLTIKVDNRGVNRLVSKLQHKQEQVRSASRQSVDNVGDTIFQRAQETVPIMTGALHDSGKIDSMGSIDQPSSLISYGDNSIGYKGQTTASYAVPRHEEPSILHPESYKWLEKSLLAASEDFRNEFLRLISEALNK